jgi:PAS domain S-box-containing protein
MPSAPEPTTKGKPSTAGISSVFAEVRREAALLKTGALQSAIFNSANFSSIATDERGVIQIFNVGAERMLGYAAADVVNKVTPAEISDPQELVARADALSLEVGTKVAPGFEALVFKASRGIEDIYELTYVRNDGSRFPAIVSVTALRDDDGRIIGYLLIGTDNTARKRVEEERKRFERALQESNIELEKAKIIAERANLAKSDFLSGMSHELRSPLNAILGFGQLMESANPEPTPLQKTRITQILNAGWHLLKLINEILDLAAIESGKASLSAESVSLAEVMALCEGMMSLQAQKRSIRLVFQKFGSPIYVRADLTRLKQVVINLVSNAIKYNREKGTVVVKCAAQGEHSVRISVRDTGVGLDPEKLAQLFQPFNRLGQEAGDEAGTGIGLMVTKRLVELMGGSIGVESEPGVGSVFWCDLDAAAPPQLKVADGRDESDISARPPLAPGAPKRSVLYVEDNPANMELVAQLLERSPDITLLTAISGSLGIEIARQAIPLAIIMDVNLPGISGIGALKILRDDPVTAHIPVIALSANAMERDISRGLELGFFRYLTKPIKVREFMETLNAAIEVSENRMSERPAEALVK